MGPVLRNRLVNRRSLVYGSVCVLLYLAILVTLPLAQYSKETLTKTGLPAADFTATDMNGDLIRLSDLRGKCVLLDFWATGCGPCRLDTPGLKTLYERHRDDLVIIGITIDTRREPVEEYIGQEQIPWPQILDEVDHDKKLWDLYGVTYMPTYVFIDRDGLVARTGLKTDNHILAHGLEHPRTFIEDLVLRIYRGSGGST